MNRQAELLELAERVEKATGPDRELDALAYAHSPDAIAFKREAYRLSAEARDHLSDGWHTRFVGQLSKPTDDPLPRFTASLDAAMSLVPEGLCVRLGMGTLLGKYSAVSEIIRGNAAELLVSFVGETVAHADAATPALALTAAALRARAHQEPTND